MNPHFFKIIMSGTTRSGKLRIPRKFVKKYENSLPSPVFLNVPGGSIWPVELLKHDGDVWLEKGWEDFANFYSLDYGHLLVFEYAATCHFHVLIFGKNTAEIDYPCNVALDADPHRGNKSTGTKAGENQDINSIEMLDDSLLGGGGGGGGGGRRRRRRRIREEESELPLSCQLKRSPRRKRSCKISKFEGKLEQYKGKRSSVGLDVMPLNFSDSLILGTAGDLPQGSSFVRVMREINFKRYFLNVPFIFFKRLCVSSIVRLKVADKIWHVTLLLYAYKKLSVLSAGWKTFMMENSLAVGDVCTFTVINGNLLEVSISRSI